ncbi:MAG: ATP-binding protein [Pseudomonadota bacterium]
MDQYSKISLSDLLAHCDQRLRDVLDAGADWVWETDKDHRFTFLSEQLNRNTKLNLENFIGMRRVDRLKQDAVPSPALEAHLDDLRNHRPFKDFEYLAKNPILPGGEAWCSVSGFPIFDADGTFLGYRGCGRNISDRMEAQLARERAEAELREMNALLERRVDGRTAELEASNARLKEREQALQLASDRDAEVNKIRSELFADISHELRTPLNGMIGTNILLQQTGLDDRQTELCQLIDRSAKSLLHLVNDLMDLARIEAGVIEMNAEWVDPAEIVQDAVDIVSPVASKKGVPLRLVKRPDLPSQIETDPARLRQILLNLLGNAIKFTEPDGQIALTAGACPLGGLRCEVEDTGIGIPEGEQAWVFERFHIGKHAEAQSSTGLGLAICRQLTEFMHGRIGMRSEHGVGSTFWFELPPKLGSAEAQSVAALKLTAQ